MRQFSIFLLCALATCPPAMAAMPDQAPLRAALEALAPGKAPDSVRPAPVPGLYEVVYGPQVFYISGDGRFVVDGDLVDLKAGRNLTEQSRSAGRLRLIEAVDPRNMIDFRPAKVKHVVTVFTDVDCPYCRELHRHIADYNRLGIEIRYLAFPRTGLDTPSYYKAVSVWCAPDRKEALTRAKLGEALPRRSCTNPVKDQFALAEELGVTGTPTMILDDGTELPGYVPPDKLIELLERKAAAAP